MTRRAGYWLTFGLILLVLAGIAAYELIASPFQAMLLADYAKRLTYRSEPGPSDSIHFPETGPYDIRFGYTSLPAFRKRLEERGYLISRQARLSPEMAKLTNYSLFLPYREKSSAGLTLNDCAGQPYYSFARPRKIYDNFEQVPALVANTLLFIENRELLDPNHPRRNPAVEWDRLAQAILEKMVKIVQPGRNVPGGSTLATQIEKYRHSPDGMTMTAQDKLRQMASASVRAYLDGSDTRVTRRRIVLDYLNTVPLAAAPGYGEVHGIGDGLDAWFGLDFDRVNALLRNPAPTPESARAYKHVLGLLISQRSPSRHLVSLRKQLDVLANAHLSLLAQAGVISPAFRDLARRQTLDFRDRKLARATAPPIDKAVSALRTEIAALLNVPRLYDLDRLDLSVATTLHGPTQAAVSERLRRLTDPAAVATHGLFGKHLLSPGSDLSKVLYSFTLYELDDTGAALRVQADSLNQPFDINQGAKLDMGSSAKLRTLITYLQFIADLHARYRSLDAGQLAALTPSERDTLTRWAIAWLKQSPDGSLEDMLRAAMGRLYSANPGEVFYTGGGLHTFVNFRKEDNGRSMDLWEATRNSVNLPFIRLMRDLVRHIVYREADGAERLLADVDDPRRLAWLDEFARKEGGQYLARYWNKYRHLTRAQIDEAMFAGLAGHPTRLAVIYRHFAPTAGPDAFRTFMRARLAAPERYSDADLDRLYESHAPGRFSLADQAYLIQKHPLELWLAAYLRQHPGAHWDTLLKASGKASVDSYAWLMKPGRKAAQDIRIQSMLESKAFEEIHARWKKLGYPFASLVPSYATAIGSSADRPAALAELMGVILNDGVKPVANTLQRLEFAVDTPYHTVFDKTAPGRETIFPPEIARVIREALVNVVHAGTARRVDGLFTSRGEKLVLGGKTGTGDHRYETYGAGGTLKESKVVNRVATFAFFAGTRFYGVITAFVPGEAAAGYSFTSALPVQLLKSMAPLLQPLIASGEGRPMTWDKAVETFEADTPDKRLARPVPATIQEADPTPPTADPTDVLNPPDAPPTVEVPASVPPKSTQPGESPTRPSEPVPAAPAHPPTPAGPDVGQGHKFI